MYSMHVSALMSAYNKASAATHDDLQTSSQHICQSGWRMIVSVNDNDHRVVIASAATRRLQRAARSIMFASPSAATSRRSTRGRCGASAPTRMRALLRLSLRRGGQDNRLRRRRQRVMSPAGEARNSVPALAIFGVFGVQVHPWQHVPISVNLRVPDISVHTMPQRLTPCSS